jgi:hypothetical protein
MCFDSAAGFRRQAFGGFGQYFLPPAANHQLGPQLQETAAHGKPKPGAPACDQNALAVQKIRLEHRFFSPKSPT